MKDYFISYKIKHNSKTRKEVVRLEKELIKKILDDKLFVESICTAKRQIDNKPKLQRVVKILLLNLIFSAQIKKGVIISQNKNILAENGLSYKIFKFVIEWLQQNKYILVTSGSFDFRHIESKRTIIKPTVSFYHFILKSIFKINLVKKATLINHEVKDHKFYCRFKGENGETYTVAISSKDNAKYVYVNKDKIFELTIDAENNVVDYNVIQ